MGPGSIAASVRSVFSGDSRQSPREQDKEQGRANGKLRKSRAEPCGAHDNPNGLEESGEENDEGSDEESDDEAMFTYSRVTKLPSTFFRKDMISACFIHPKLHVYATDTGVVHMVSSDGDPIRTVRVHRSSVLDVVVDQTGNFIATASIDGTVMVASVQDPVDIVQANFRRPVHAIALHSDYANTKSYVSGGTAGQIILSERGWLKSRADTVLMQTSSTILALAWTSLGLVWCNEDGITIYDIDARAVRSKIDRFDHSASSSNGGSEASDGFTPRLFVNRGQVIVAWSSTIFVVDLKTGLLLRRIDLAYAVAGAVPFYQSQIAVLTINKDAEPELKLLSATNGSELYADELEMRSVSDGRGDDKHKREQMVMNQYHLLAAFKTEENDSDQETGNARLWIINSKDAIIARERNARDHLDWLFEHHKYVEAYQAAKSATKFKVSDEEKLELGRRAAQQLIDQKLFEAAAFVLGEILDSGDSTGWLLSSNQFINAGKSLVLGDVLPVALKLDDRVRDTILDAAIEAGDHSRLRTWVKTWPLDVYDGPLLVHKLEKKLENSKLSDTDSETNMQLVYADLLLKLGEYVNAVKALVQANSSHVFRIVSHYHLWTEPEIVQMLGAILVAGDGDLGDGGYVARLRELIAFRAEISPIKVAQQLQSESSQNLLLFGYLSELRLVDETILGEKPLVDLMIKLYAKYDRQKLLGFLEKFDTYDIDSSVEMCRRLGLTNELVYLLGRLGQSREALTLIVTELKDYERAVSFARSQDPEIWDQLVGYASQSPGLVLALLKCLEVSPARVLAMVPADMPIPGLKSALCRVLNDQEVSVALHNGALTIVNNESREWTQKLRHERLAGTLGDLKDMEKKLATEDACWKEGAILISDQEGTSTYKPAESFKGNVNTLTGKIRHLKWLWSRT